MTIEEITSEFSEVKARHKLLKGDLDGKLEKIITEKERVGHMVKARWVLTEVATATQRRFKEKVETLVTMAIRSVFDRPFQFLLEFERKRNKMECRPEIKELVDGKFRTFDPSEDMGGGIVDIISFALRIVLLSISVPHSRNTIILDEPMKNLGKLITLGGQVIKEISHKLGIQIILVTHDDSLMEIGDKSFFVTHDGNKSSVREMTKSNVMQDKPIIEVKQFQIKRKIIRDQR
jgi:hypothetical protein